MGEQQIATDSQETWTSACPHLEAVGKRWGDPISEERQTELDALAAKQAAWVAQPEAMRGDSPLKDVALTGAEVFWLAQGTLAGSAAEPCALSAAAARLQDPDLRFTCDLSALHLEGANLRAAHLEGAYLRETRLEGAYLRETRLEGAYLREAHLEGARLNAAYLEGANLRAAHLEGAGLNGAHLENAVLIEARMEGAHLREARLGGAYLFGVHLEGKTYSSDDADWLRVRAVIADFPATLLPADLREAFLDSATTVRNATLCTPEATVTPRIADARWGGVNLAVIDWTPFTERGAPLGDEWQAHVWKPVSFQESDDLKVAPRRERAAARAAHAAAQQRARLDAWAAATRANRQMATALRGQGMSDEADHFAYRAQVCQRRLFQLQGKRGRALFSRFLNLLAGYGYKPVRTVIVYSLVIAAFSGLYLLASNGLLTFGLPRTAVHSLAWYEALVLSVSSFHGRGFFQPLQNPGDPIAILAAIEAVFGLIIEVSFIATFTQRFFGTK